MKRRELIRHLERFGCILADEGAKHSKAQQVRQSRRSRRQFQDIPKIVDFLARKICRQLGIPDPK